MNLQDLWQVLGLLAQNAGACIPHIYCSQEGEISDMQIHSGKHPVQPK